MQRIDMVMREHIIEEIGEGGNQASPEGVKMDGDLGGHPINRGAGSRPSHRHPALIGIGVKRWANDTSPSYLLFQTLLPLFWILTCMI